MSGIRLSLKRGLSRGGPSRTARQDALFRALESRVPPDQRVAHDSLAASFLTADYRLLAELARVGVLRDLIENVIDRRWPCARAGVVVRTRLIDDVIEAELPNAGQVVVLGAGFDSRAYRLEGMQATTIFEVDHPSTQAEKKRIVARLLGGLPSHVTFVPVVFGREDPAERLYASGFARGVATIVLWEGVTNYLTAEAVDTSFGFLSFGLKPSSLVVFTYVHRGILDGSATFEGAAQTMEAVRGAGEPVTFGFDPDDVAAYVAKHGFTLVSDVALAEVAPRFYPNRQLPKSPMYYRVAQCRKE
jgi:methyltransferase (TIGR00027 family)